MGVIVLISLLTTQGRLVRVAAFAGCEPDGVDDLLVVRIPAEEEPRRPDRLAASRMIEVAPPSVERVSP